jgi:hypothetical protein
MTFPHAFHRAGRPLALLCLLIATLALLPACATFAATGTTGEQKTAVILVNFQDNATQPKTPVEVHELVFGQVSDFFWEASYQKTFLSGDVFGWFTIPVATNNCDVKLIVQEANHAAMAVGANLAAYSQFVYMFPDNSGCGWSGLEEKGAAGERLIYINGNAGFALKPVAHEMGHGLGLMHSNALDCDVSATGNTCTLLGYADPADTMGTRGAHFNAFQKELLGWLNAAGAPPITTVTASGRYAIAPLETYDQRAKALKILKGNDPTTGVKTWYYLELRQLLGFDSILAGRGNLASGVLVHTGSVSATGISNSLLLDTTPNSSELTRIADFEDGALGVGRTYVDAAAGVTVTVVSIDANGAVLDVEVGGAPPPACVRVSPAITLTGPGSAVAAGTTVKYTVKVLNRDSSSCAATTFNLARSVPSGWTGSLAMSSMSLSPGASSSTSLDVISPATAAATSYGIGVGGGSNVGSIHTANASASYVVAASASHVLSTSVGTDKTAYSRGESVYLSARVLDNGTPLAGASVRFNITLPSGASSVLSASSGADGYARSSYKLGKGKAVLGSYQVRADASSGGASASAGSAFSVR